MSYAKSKGFGVRKDDIRRLANGVLCFRGFVCSQEGFRDEINMVGEKERERPLVRCGCLAKFGVTLDRRTETWFVSEFIDNHNHILLNQEEVVHLRSHRHIDEVKKSEIISLQFAGLRKSQIMDVMVEKAGGFTNVGHTMKDLYNMAAKNKSGDIEGGDAEQVLIRMKNRRELDIEFFFDYKKDDEEHLIALFWADAQSRLDYQCFGDVLIFDSTYRVNRYNMPFIPFVGVNHHRSTSVFGCGIVANESVEAYKWLLSTLLTAMYQNHPKSVITDGCPSMARAIREILPRSAHRICSWHIEKNMKRYLHVSNHHDFKALLYNNYGPVEFERRWDNYISKSKSLENNEWLKMMYRSKESWAEGYLQNKLFLRMTSSQRSESLNARLKMHLDRNMHLVNMVDHYEHCLSRIRRTEVELDAKASYSIPVAKTKFKELEKDAARIYTPKVFCNIRMEFARAMDYTVVEITEDCYRKWYVLEYNENTEKQVVVECSGVETIDCVKCTCMKLECEKIPCGHMLRVFIEMKAAAIPRCCIWRRYTKSPKTRLPVEATGFLFNTSEQMKRNRELSRLGGAIFYESSKTDSNYLSMKEVLLRQLKSQKKHGEVKEEDVQTNQGEATSPIFGVRDPKVMVGRGAPKKRMKSFDEMGTRKCGHCRKVGHNKTTCPMLRKK